MNITIVADDGNIIQRQTVAVNVADLSIYTPLPGAVLQTPSPGSGALTFTVAGIPPYSFSCPGLPAGATCAASGTQAPFPAQSQIAVTVTTPSGLPAANTPFQVNVSSEGQSASAQATLGVFTFALQAPTPATDWAFPGASQNVTFPVQATNLSAADLTLTCTINIPGAACSQLIWPISSSAPAISDYVPLTVPAGTPVGQYQMAVTASVEGATQSYTFPFNIVSLSASLSASSLSINNLGSGSLNVTLNATSGFNGTVGLGCSYQPALSCSFTPYPVALVGGTPQTAVLTIRSTGLAGNHQPPPPFSRRTGLLLTALLPIGLLWRFRQLRSSTLFTSLIAAALLTFMASCGSGGVNSSGGSSSAPPGGSGGGGTPPSTSYTLTITGMPSSAGSNQNLGTVTVNVTQ